MFSDIYGRYPAFNRKLWNIQNYEKQFTKCWEEHRTLTRDRIRRNSRAGSMELVLLCFVNLTQSWPERRKHHWEKASIRLAYTNEEGLSLLCGMLPLDRQCWVLQERSWKSHRKQTSEESCFKFCLHVPAWVPPFTTLHGRPSFVV